MFKIQCHCGNVEILATKRPESLASCNCSICRRYAALWAYYEPEMIAVDCKYENTQFYLWGDKEVEFHSCPRCACLTHYLTTEKCDDDDTVIALNMRMAKPEDVVGIPRREINGADY